VSSKGDLDRAEAAARKAIDLGDENTQYHLGVIHFNRQQYPESRQAFERFLKRQEGHVGALKYLALAFLRMNQPAEAVKVHLRILEVYFNENLLDEARQVRQTILELDPANAEVQRYDLGQTAASVEAALPEEASGGPSPEESARQEEEQQSSLLSQAQSFVDKGFYEQAIDVYLEMLKRWPQLPDVRVRLQQVYALVARSLEPVEKAPSAEEIKSELERELRQHVQREMEEQARAAQERQRDLDRRREEEQERLRQELEGKLQEHRKSKEEEWRQQLTREFEEKQRQLTLQQERVANEQARMMESRAEMEKRIREQIEREMRDKTEKEQEIRTVLNREAEVQRQEEEERERYLARKREEEAARAKVNQEILQGMERLRREKEMETKGPARIQASEQAPAAVAAPSAESLEDPFVRQSLADIYAAQGLYVEALKIYEKILNEEPNNEHVREK
jgi:tetratricopeptide (TPR) repeat protein